MTNKKSPNPIGFFAPGNYLCKCAICGNTFKGDKRAVECEPCATSGKEAFDKLSPKEQEEVMRRNVEIFNNLIKGKQ